MYRRPVLIVLALALLAACGRPTSSFGEVANTPHDHSDPADHSHDTTSGAHSHDTGATSTAGDALVAVVPTSEIVVGPNRVALGLLENNVPIPDAAETQLKVRYYRLKGDQATVVGEETARYYNEGLGERGTYVIHPTFDTPGTWGLELEAQRPGKPVTTKRISIEVAAAGSAVAVGAPAPRTKTPTAAEVQDLHTITSSSEPDPRLYQLSVDQAVGNGKPSMILFATPGFCQTAVCGPGVDVLRALADRFGDHVNAVHVEVYQYPFEELKPVATMQEWGLKTEPWLFLVDRDGRVAARFEGGITIPEIEPEVAKLVG
ncbi:MAG TPA: hypothetical protein VLA19_29005 [Herpetosiphonaceae bacterium]|nr:hypothetical protein [Herpetosiphonaceae bacterium]